MVNALLTQLETDAATSRCSKLFLVVSQGTPLRGILQTNGYAITLEGTDLVWLEKAFRSEPESRGRPMTALRRRRVSR